MTSEERKAASGPLIPNWVGHEDVRGCWVYSPASVERIWGIWGSYENITQAIFFVLNGDYPVWTV